MFKVHFEEKMRVSINRTPVWLLVFWRRTSVETKQMESEPVDDEHTQRCHGGADSVDTTLGARNYS